MLQEGDEAPDFRLPAQRRQRGRAFQPARQARGAVFLSQGDDRRDASIEASEFRDAKPQFDKAGAVVLGCSARQRGHCRPNSRRSTS